MNEKMININFEEEDLIYIIQNLLPEPRNFKYIEKLLICIDINCKELKNDIMKHLDFMLNYTNVSFLNFLITNNFIFDKKIYYYDNLNIFQPIIFNTEFSINDIQLIDKYNLLLKFHEDPFLKIYNIYKYIFINNNNIYVSDNAKKFNNKIFYYLINNFDTYTIKSLKNIILLNYTQYLKSDSHIKLINIIDDECYKLSKKL